MWVSFVVIVGRVAIASATDSLCLLQRDAHVVEKNASRTPGLSEGGGNHKNNHWKMPTCAAPGQLYFAHIMKDGGSSVDVFLNCICNDKNCSVEHVEGERIRKGHISCEPSICTSHGSIPSRSSACGASFEHSSVFTVLRHPVDRVFSFYTYMRYHEKVEYYKQPLEAILTNLKKCHESQSLWLCSEFSNAVSGKYLANNMVSELNADRNADPVPGGFTLSYVGVSTDVDVKEAKKQLERMKAVFFTEDFKHFTTLFGKSGLPLSGNAQKCPLPHALDTKCDDCKPTLREEELIRELNWADIQLYNHAKNFSNSKRMKKGV